MKSGFDALRGLYEKYAEELVSLSVLSHGVYNNFLSKGYGATFADVESEILYMLVRSYKPKVVFEVSPDCGYSTHYILQALTKNNYGDLYSFELSKTIRGIPTEEVISAVQHPSSDLNRLHVIIGDARLKTLQTGLTPDLVFIDSCHEDYFAEWYIKCLLALCKGPALIHDIMYPKGTPEFSSESYYVQLQLLKMKCPHVFIGDFDDFFENERAKMFLHGRREYYSNALLIEDCSCLNLSLSEYDKGLIMQYFSTCNDAWKIQSSQLPDWKDREENTGEYLKSGAAVFTRQQYEALFEMLPLTFTHETLLDNSAERLSKTGIIKANINNVSNLYSFVTIKSKIKDGGAGKKCIGGDSGFLTATDSYNPVEVFHLLSNMQKNPSEYYNDKNIAGTIIKNPCVAVFWKLKIIESINESAQWKYSQVNFILPEIQNSLIYNKFLALQIINDPLLLNNLIPAIFSDYNITADKRYPILYRYLTFILKKYRKYITEQLREEMRNSILLLSKNKRKAAFEASTELLLCGDLKTAMRIYNNYKKNNRVGLQERLIYFRQIKSKIKEFLRSRIMDRGI
ncbi:MAG: class I SAM-dependent methyltransferase [Nitrospirae bacterium YQR-1]